VTRAALLAIAACSVLDKPPTELVVTVDTTFGVPCTIDSLHIDVTTPHGTVSRDVAVTDADLPGSFAIVPAGGAESGTVNVAVTGMRAGEAFATAMDTTTFDKQATLEMRFVIDRTCVPGPCAAAGVGGYHGLPAKLARRGCGANGYVLQPSVFAIRDACTMADPTSGIVMKSQDEMEAMLPLAPLPFPFSFYGQPVSSLWVGTNGYLAFSDTAPNALTSDVGAAQPLASASFPAPAVLPFWDDLRTSAHGICYAVTGTMPDRILWVTWEEACFAAGAATCGMPAQGTLTFSAALEETSDNVYIGYSTMTATTDRAKGLTATIGVTDTGGSAYSQFSAQHTVDPLVTLEALPQ
jgi:hypothetical protein